MFDATRRLPTRSKSSDSSSSEREQSHPDIQPDPPLAAVLPPISHLNGLDDHTKTTNSEQENQYLTPSPKFNRRKNKKTNHKTNIKFEEGGDQTPNTSSPQTQGSRPGPRYWLHDTRFSPEDPKTESAKKKETGRWSHDKFEDVDSKVQTLQISKKDQTLNKVKPQVSDFQIVETTINNYSVKIHKKVVPNNPRADEIPTTKSKRYLRKQASNSVNNNMDLVIDQTVPQVNNPSTPVQTEPTLPVLVDVKAPSNVEPQVNKKLDSVDLKTKTKTIEKSDSQQNIQIKFTQPVKQARTDSKSSFTFVETPKKPLSIVIKKENSIENTISKANPPNEIHISSKPKTPAQTPTATTTPTYPHFESQIAYPADPSTPLYPPSEMSIPQYMMTHTGQMVYIAPNGLMIPADPGYAYNYNNYQPYPTAPPGYYPMPSYPVDYPAAYYPQPNYYPEPYSYVPEIPQVRPRQTVPVRITKPLTNPNATTNDKIDK